MTDDATPREVGSHAGLGLEPEREEVERINALGRQHIDQMNLIGALELVAFARAVQAEERERIAAHFDERDRGPDGKPLGIGFYDPHEPAEIIRALWPNDEVELRRQASARTQG
jgi:hypothetical protein